MSTKLPIIIGIVLILAVGAFVLLQQTPASSTTTQNPPVTNEPVATTTPNNPATSTPSTSAGTYTMAQVATHASASSCWSIIDGNVYDLTTWIPQHPGGPQRITALCGKDGTAAFHGQHADAKKQADILVTFKIGVLAR